MECRKIGVSLSIAALATLAALGQDSVKDLRKPGRTVNIRTLQFSADGKYLAGSSGEPKDKGQVVLWDVQTHQLIWKRDFDQGVPALAFSPNSKSLAVGTFTENCFLIDVITGKVMTTLPGHGESARSVAFSPDGKTLAVGSYDKSIRLWDWQEREVKQRLKAHNQRVFSLQYLPDGKTLVSGDVAGSVCLWNASSAKLLHQWNERGNPMALDAKGKWFLTAGNDASVTVHSLEDFDKILARYENIYAYRVLVVHPSGKQFASHSGFGLRLDIFPIDLASATPLDEQRIQKLIALWESDDVTIRDKASLGLTQLGNAARPFLEKAANGNASAEVRIRACAVLGRFGLPKPLAQLTGHHDHVNCVSFSSDGKLLATGGRDGQVLLWETANYQKKTAILWPTRD